MTVPITPTSPVNPLITIQPITTTIPSRNDGAVANPLANLAPGTLVEGFVVNRDAQSNPILRTSLGDLRITSDVFLKTGSEVVFRVDTSQSTLARIVTVDGLTPQDYSTQSARSLTRDTITPSGFQALGTTSATTATGAPLAANTPPASALLQAIVLQVYADTKTPTLAPPTLAPPTLAPPTLAPPTLAAQALNLAQSTPLPIVSQLASLRSGSPLRLTVLDVRLPPIAVSLTRLPTSSNLGALLVSPTSSASSNLLPTTAASSNASTTSTSITSGLTISAPILPTVISPAAIATPASDTPTSNAPTSNAPTSNAPTTLPNASLLSSSSAQPPAVPASTAAAIPTNVPKVVSRPTAPASSAPAGSQPLQPVGPHQLVASVIGHDADGANIVHTTIASLKIYTPQPLPSGTDLLVQIAPPSAQDAPIPTTIATLSGFTPGTSLTQQLGVFAQLLSWLNAHQPDVAQSASGYLPTIGPQLTNGLLHFLTGIRSSDISELIGKRALQLLEVSNPDILARLRQQVEQLQVGFLATPIAQWSLLPIPLFFAGELHLAKLFIHQEPPEEAAGSTGAGRGQRFILEIETSKLGALQFDGFVRSHERGKSFDLMVRSSIGLPEDVSLGIRELFNSNLASTRLNGQIIFQAGSQHFVKPTAPSAAFSSLGINTILA